MKALRVQITRVVDASQPGFVECRLQDAFGRSWVFVEKIPVVTNANLNAASAYPQDGVIACDVLASRRLADGREVLTVDTRGPWGVEATTGDTRFEILPDQVFEVPG
ncbi:MAG: hypothetical protein BIFFINMI_04377 [Phycisphaerae bacterium]|nr:hypothetical protein [Phycisphaerae bacterium]